MRPERTRRAGHRNQQRLEVPIEPQRHLRDLRALDDAAGVGAIGLQHRRLAGDDHRLFELADSEHDFHADRGIDADLDALAREFLETDELAVNAVHAWSEVVEGIIA